MNEPTLAEMKKIDPEALGSHYGLEIWHRSVLAKRLSELDLRDLSTMLRQDLYADIALPIAWEILLRSPFEGEMWDGQLLETVVDYLTQHPIACRSIQGCKEFIEKLGTRLEEYEWDYENGPSNYQQAVNRLNDLLDSSGNG
jgi:CDI immunity proteins